MTDSVPERAEWATLVRQALDRLHLLRLAAPPEVCDDVTASVEAVIAAAEQECERLRAELAEANAEVAAMRPVVEAAVAWCDYEGPDDPQQPWLWVGQHLYDALDAYRRTKAET